MKWNLFHKLFNENKNGNVSVVKSDKLDNLDSLRGCFAFIVVLHHYCIWNKNKLINSEYRLVEGWGGTVGVFGFFILSAFLLTYRLLQDFHRISTTIGNYNRLCLLVLVKYTIRRFFRIYFVFAIFWTISYVLPHDPFVAYFNRKPDSVYNYTKGLMLGGELKNTHLWTIPVEIKYYFLIPLISFATIKFGRLWFIVPLCLSAYTVYLELTFRNESYMPMLRAINVFLKGSIIAIIYFKIKTNEKANKFNEIIRTNSPIQFLLNLVLFFATVYLLRLCSVLYNDNLTVYVKYKASYIMSFIILGLLFSNNNHSKRLASNFYIKLYQNEFLNLCGKYSFGIYLYHMIVLNYIIKHQYYFKTYLDQIVVLCFSCLVIAIIWFYLIEDKLMKNANSLCKKVEKLEYFSTNIPTHSY